MTNDTHFDGLTVGYDIPALPGMREDEIVTPALIVDLDALEANLRRLGDYATTNRIRLRPHGKMHKSADIARLQAEIGGASGICCQKVSEAEAFARAGIKDILVSNQVCQPQMIERLAKLATGDMRIAVCVDNAENVLALSRAAQSQGTQISCLVEVDTGGRRCGVAPGEATVELARIITDTPGLEFAGIQAYHGAAQHILSHRERKLAVQRSIECARHAKEALLMSGLPCPAVTGGGTGSYEFEAESRVYTELQCGSYAFMDVHYGLIEDEEGRRVHRFENALFLLTTVMSHAQPARAVCDAGLKVLATDSGLPVVWSREDVAYVSASDEHGILADAGKALKVGDKLRLIPGHCDPTCNLHDWYVGLRMGRVETLWPITARGKSW